MSNKIVDLYKSGLTGVQISKELSVSLDKIYKVLKDNNLTRNRSEVKQKYIIKDIDFFKLIDSHQKAYFLGLLYSDGWVEEKTNQVCIQLKSSDKNLLDSLSDLIYVNRPLIHKKSKDKTRSDSYKLVMSNISIFNDCIKLGLTPRKSMNKVFPKSVPNVFYSSFLLGYFDGNGCIGKSSRCNKVTYKARNVYYLSIISTKEFLEKVSEIFTNSLNILTPKIVKKHKNDNNIYSISFASLNDIIKIREFFYANDLISMDRKKNIFYNL